jgi:phosphoglycerate dehydrogenase-like enzyme
MEVIAWSENLTAARARDCGVQWVSKNDLLSSSDVLTIHLVLSARTRGLIGTEELQLMKSSAYLVNTSRGPIVDETALIDALKRKSIRGAALDVYDTEPLPSDHPIRKLDNAVLTGHTGYVIRDNFVHGYGEVVEDVLAWLVGKPLRLLN